MLDEDRFIERLKDEGLLPADETAREREIAALRNQLARTQTELDALRRDRPDLKAEVDRAISAVNAADPEAARAAFADANATLEVQAAAQEAAVRLEQARLKNAEATLLYPFTASKAEPLLCEAAELARTEVRYWIECGRARVDIGDLDAALTAFSAGP